MPAAHNGRLGVVAVRLTRSFEDLVGIALTGEHGFASATEGLRFDSVGRVRPRLGWSLQPLLVVSLLLEPGRFGAVYERAERLGCGLGPSRVRAARHEDQPSGVDRQAAATGPAARGEVPAICPPDTRKGG